MIVPTPGRIVWYRARAREGIITNGDQPLAAIVATVHSDTCVNLTVFGADGALHQRPNTVLNQDEAHETAPGECCWMPYQRGQAAKLDELTAKAEPVPQEPQVNPAPSTTEIAEAQAAQAAEQPEQTQAQSEQAPQG